MTFTLAFLFSASSVFPSLLHHFYPHMFPFPIFKKSFDPMPTLATTCILFPCDSNTPRKSSFQNLSSQHHLNQLQTFALTTPSKLLLSSQQIQRSILIYLYNCIFSFKIIHLPTKTVDSLNGGAVSHLSYLEY